MRMLWWDIVKHVEYPGDVVKFDLPAPEPAPVEEDLPGLHRVFELLEDHATELDKLRRDVNRIDRANYRAIEKVMPPNNGEIPVEVKPQVPVEQPRVDLRAGDVVPPGYFGGV